MSEVVRMNLEISPELYKTLESLAYRSGVSLSDVFRKAIALMEIAELRGHYIVFNNLDVPTENGGKRDLDLVVFGRTGDQQFAPADVGANALPRLSSAVEPGRLHSLPSTLFKE